jgi:general secretion pathway protein F/type IV pilus assembly protein PilC
MIAKDATGNQVLIKAISEAADEVSAGKSLSRPLSASGHFPDELIEMIAVSEEANNLEQVLLEIAEGLEQRTSQRIDVFVRMLEPVLLLVLAGIILFVLTALLLPIFQTSSIVT